MLIEPPPANGAVDPEDDEPLLAPLVRKGLQDPTPNAAHQWILRRCFRLPAFRKGQFDVIARILSGTSTLAVFPTGWGKSLCYLYCTYANRLLSQQSMWKVTLVVSPLLSVMEDQVCSANEANIGLRSAAITSGMNQQQQGVLLKRLCSGAIDVLHVSPERLVTNAALRDALRRIAANIGLICIDEAHCITQWSHDFRPCYIYLHRSLSTLLGGRTPPILALTATASGTVRAELCSILQIQEVVHHHADAAAVSSKMELRSTVLNLDDFDGSAACHRRFAELWNVLQTHSLPTPMLIYAATQAEADDVATFLRHKYGQAPADFPNLKRGRDGEALDANKIVASYHAGLSSSERRRIQSQFLRSEILILSATVAFGLGIDKRDIRSVVHMHVPASLEEYVQQTGRAGRDGLPFVCQLLYCPRDYYRFQQRNQFSILSFEQISRLLRRLLTPPPSKLTDPNRGLSLVFPEELGLDEGCSTETVETLLFLALTAHSDSVTLVGNIPRKARILWVKDKKAPAKGGLEAIDVFRQLDIHDPVASFLSSHEEIVDMLSVADQLALPVLEFHSRIRELAEGGYAKLRFLQSSYLIRIADPSPVHSGEHFQLLVKEMFHRHRSRIHANNKKLREAFACLAEPSFDRILEALEDPSQAPQWKPPATQLSLEQAVRIVNDFCGSHRAPAEAVDAAKALCGLVQPTTVPGGSLVASRWTGSPYFGKLEEFEFEWVLKACRGAVVQRHCR